MKGYADSIGRRSVVGVEAGWDRVRAARERRRVMFNDDCYELSREDANTPEGFLKRRLKPLVGTHASTIAYCVIVGDAPVYDSKAQPIFGDAHGRPSPYWGEITTWKMRHPEWLVDTNGTLPEFELYTSSQDFSHETVRLRKLEIIEEICERYDVDGFELDYIRHPVLASEKELENATQPPPNGRETDVLCSWRRQERL